MRIRIDGKEILKSQATIVELVVEEKDTLQITTPAADQTTCMYVMSYDNSKLSIEGGASIIDSLSGKGMEIPFLRCTFEISKTNGLFMLNGNVLDKSEMYNLSVLMVPRIIRQLLDNSEIQYENFRSKDLEIFRVDKSNQVIFEEMVKQCIEYRCSQSADIGSCEILRQLPISVAIEESDKLIALGKKHAIYASARGGYNIKVKDYRNGRLDQYCYYDSKMWD
jgi:hypothetical protein